MSWDGSTDTVWNTERLRIATDAAGVALWSWNVDTGEIALDEKARDLWCVTKSGPITFEDLSAHIHPADLARVRAAFTVTRTTLGPYDLDFRILHGDAIRWISARGRGGDQGIVGRIMFGVFLDITERKLIEESREMLAGEMSHRVKNLFAVASALTVIAARSAATTSEMAQDLTLRLTALGHAHDLVRPDPALQSRSALLSELFTVLLAPYDDRTPGRTRVHVDLPVVRVGETAATTLALIVHELATNSIKYGALSATGGTLDVSCRDLGDPVILLWTERGGPTVVAPAGMMGFGSKLVTQGISDQLGGSIAFDWQPAGLVVTLQFSKARLVA